MTVQWQAQVTFEFAALLDGLKGADLGALVVNLAVGLAHHLAELVVESFFPEIILLLGYPFLQPEVRFDDEFGHGFLLVCFFAVSSNSDRYFFLGVLGDAPGADHLHVVVHEPPRRGGVARLDQVDQLAVHVDDVARHRRRQRPVARRPRHVLQRDQLGHQHAVVRRLGDRQVEVAARAGERVEVVDLVLSVLEQRPQFRDVRGGGVFGRKLCGHAFDAALRVHDLAHFDAGELELHRQRLGEQPRIAMRDARAAAGAHADLDNAERLQRAQRVARHDAAHVEARRQFLLGGEEVAGLEALFEQRLAHFGDDLVGERAAAAVQRGPLVDAGFDDDWTPGHGAASR